MLKLITPSSNGWANGGSQSWIGNIHKVLYFSNSKAIVKGLHWAQYSYKTSFHPATGMTPFNAVSECDPLLGIHHGSPPPPLQSINKWHCPLISGLLLNKQKITNEIDAIGRNDAFSLSVSYTFGLVKLNFSKT